MSAYKLIDAEKANYSVTLLCSALEVSTSAYYEWANGEVSERQKRDEALKVHIKAIHRRSRGTYGSPRVHRELLEEGHLVGRKRVSRLMAELALCGIPKRKFKGGTTDSEHGNAVADNVLQRNFNAERPNEAWVGDITYLATAEGWVYLAVLIDLHSRKVVGWALESHMETELCLTALRQALTTREPPAGLVHHSDRGSQYASHAYQAVLRDADCVASMSRKGNCWDNAVAESFFGTLEQELVAQSELWQDADDARRAVGDYIHQFYNLHRRHSTIGMVSPTVFETEYRQSCQEAA